MLKYLYLIILLVINTSISFANDLTYKLVFYDDRTIDITISFTGNENGKTKLYLPTYVWNMDFREYIRPVKLVTKNMYFKNIEDAKYIIHKPNAQIILNYKLRLENDLKEYSLDNPFVFERGFHFAGSMGLVIPEINFSNFRLDWDKHQKFKVPDFLEGYIPTIKNIEDIHDIYIFGGDYKHNNFKIDNKYNVTISTLGNIESEKIKQDLHKFLLSLANLFYNKNDFNLKYVIVKKPFINHLHGTKFNNYLVVTIPENKNVDEAVSILYHETTHSIFGSNGAIYATPETDTLYKWFLEGFTDYYSYKIALKAGLMSNDEYITKYNDILKKYFSSLVLKATNQEISQNYFNSFHLQRLIYYRGTIIAQEIDTLIYKVTNGKMSLDDVIKKLAKDIHTYKYFTNEIFIKTINEITGSDLTKEINEMINSHDIKLSDSLYNYNLKYTKYFIPDFGFDLLYCTLSGKIKLNKNGNKVFGKQNKLNNKICSGYSLDLYDDKKEAILYVKDNQQSIEKEIKFFPVTKEMLVPIYK